MAKLNKILAMLSWERHNPENIRNNKDIIITLANQFGQEKKSKKYMKK